MRHDYSRTLRQYFWLANSAEIAEQVYTAVAAAFEYILRFAQDGQASDRHVAWCSRQDGRPLHQSRLASPGFMRSVLGIDPEDDDTDASRIQAMVDALLRTPMDMVGFFRSLTETTVRASEQAHEFESAATTVRQLRDLFGEDLQRLEDEDFFRLFQRAFTREMVEYKQAFRRECLAAMDVRAALVAGRPHSPVLPAYDDPEIAAKMAEFYRKNCSLLMGAWDAFGAALVEEATRRQLPITRPDTRNLDGVVSTETAKALSSFNTIVAEKTVGDPIRFVGKALRLIMAQPAGESRPCSGVLAAMRQAADIPEGRAGNRAFELLFGEEFKQAAAAASRAADPSVAMTLRVWCTWMREAQAAKTLGILDFNTAVLLNRLEAGLASS